jgi:hypothetical protein
MAVVTALRPRGNLAPARRAQSLDLSPSLWHALAVAARKPAANCRDGLAPGVYEVCETVRVVGTLSVGHDADTAATVTPGADVLLGLVLAKLNSTTRQAILRELPADFAAAGADYPAVPDEIVAEAEALTAQLRRKVTQHRRGAVTGDLTAELVPAPRLSLARTNPR